MLLKIVHYFITKNIYFAYITVLLDMNTESELALRQIFKQFNRFMLLLWRLGLGPWLSLWPEVGGQITVIVHTDRKSGVRRYTPVNFAELDGQLYCCAGFGNVSDWYKNILANPQVEIWHPQGWWQGIAKDISQLSPDPHPAPGCAHRSRRPGRAGLALAPFHFCLARLDVFQAPAR